MSSSLTSTAAVTRGEQRPRAGVGQRRGGDAADLQPGRDVGQQLVLGGRVLARSRRARRPRRRPPVRSRSAGSASAAVACPRWCRPPAARPPAGRRAAALRARRPRRPAPRRRRRSPPTAAAHRHGHLHRRRVDQPAGAADPDQRPPLAGFHPRRRGHVEAELDGAAGRQHRAQRGRADPLPGAPGADQVRLQRQVGARVGADRDGQPAESPAASSTSAGSSTR